MKRLAQSAAKTVFPLGILGSLGFGAVQATAAPPSAAAPPYCNLSECNQICLAASCDYGICPREYGCGCVC
jgi:hypothetical protein